MPPTFVPDTAGMHDVFRSVDGPLGRYVDELVDRMVVEAEGMCPVAPPPEFPPGRWAHPPLHTTMERSRVYATADGVGARYGSNAPYASSVHDGSRPHKIRARFAKTLRFRNKSGVVVFPVEVDHPGTTKARANPWLLRAAHRILNG